MIEGDGCNFCSAVLDTHCDLYGKENPKVCEVKEDYWTTGMSSEQALDRLYNILTPEQLQRADPEVTRRMKAHEYTRQSPTFGS